MGSLATSRSRTDRLDQRQTRRTKVFMLADLRHAGTSLRAHVLDISEFGALLHVPSTSLNKRDVTLTVLGEAEAAALVWVDNNRLGIKFATPLSTDRLRRIVAG